MRADTWFPFYVNDYLGDTMHLTTEQHGAYVLLIMAAWKRGGPLPDDDGQLAGIARLTLPAWRKMAPIVRAYFKSTDGMLHHGRVAKELDKAQRLSNARRESGAKGGRPRKLEESDKKPIGLANPKQNGLQTKTPTRVAPPSQLHPPTEVSEDKSSGAVAPFDLDASAWEAATMVLRDQGRMTEKSARSFFGKLLSENRIEARDLLASLTQAMVNQTGDPQSYLRRAAGGVASRRAGHEPMKRVGFV